MKLYTAESASMVLGIHQSRIYQIVEHMASKNKPIGYRLSTGIKSQILFTEDDVLRMKHRNKMPGRPRLNSNREEDRE